MTAIPPDAPEPDEAEIEDEGYPAAYPDPPDLMETLMKSIEKAKTERRRRTTP